MAEGFSDDCPTAMRISESAYLFYMFHELMGVLSVHMQHNSQKQQEREIVLRELETYALRGRPTLR
jgi:hypothetical protein